MRKRWPVMLMAAVLIGTSVPAVCAENSQIQMKNQKNYIMINGRKLEVPGGIIEVQGERLYPLRWMTEQMGGSVKWNQADYTAIVTNPLYQEEHLYLSYLGALIYNNENETEYALPKRIETLKLPDKYPLSSENGKMLNEKPVGITISDDGFDMEYVAYDYEIFNNRLYVSAEWLNTIFLAQVEETLQGEVVTYPGREGIDIKLAEIENVLAPVTPKETLALWIKGQQERSGALQYSSLSPELKKQVVDSKRNWVTGGSSPSAGKAVISSQKQLNDGTYVYDLVIDEMLEGKVSGTVKQQITVQKYELEGKEYWFITKASGDLSYFTLLSDKE